MKIGDFPDRLLRRLSERVESAFGLHFPEERFEDLQRGLVGAAKDLGFSDAGKFTDALCSGALSARQIDVLAHHLTIGETYFYRDPRMFEALSETVLPEIIRARASNPRERRLRIWSAACCSGEEAYSLAILLEQVIPDITQWHITILATDINARVLQKAGVGVYGQWSFRDVPAGFKERYFQRTPDGKHAILPSIKRRVKFAQLNLVEDVFPSLITDTNAMDLILCRNVLMYFSPAQLQKVVRNLHHALVDGGWLVVSPSEVSQQLFPGFKSVNFPGAILYRKTSAPHRAETPSAFESAFFAADLESPPDTSWMEEVATVPIPDLSRAAAPEPDDRVVLAEKLFEEGEYVAVSDLLVGEQDGTGGPKSNAEFSLLARALANQSELSEALRWCDRWIAWEKLSASGHYLRAIVLQELGDLPAARQALQNALYLQPEMVLAHFALGNLTRTQGQAGEAQRHFRNALRLVERSPADEVVPESDGLTAGRLAEILNSLLTMENVA